MTTTGVLVPLAKLDNCHPSTSSDWFLDIPTFVDPRFNSSGNLLILSSARSRGTQSYPNEIEINAAYVPLSVGFIVEDSGINPQINTMLLYRISSVSDEWFDSWNGET